MKIALYDQIHDNEQRIKKFEEQRRHIAVEVDGKMCKEDIILQHRDREIPRDNTSRLEDKQKEKMENLIEKVMLEYCQEKENKRLKQY